MCVCNQKRNLNISLFTPDFFFTPYLLLFPLFFFVSPFPGSLSSFLGYFPLAGDTRPLGLWGCVVVLCYFFCVCVFIGFFIGYVRFLLFLEGSFQGLLYYDLYVLYPPIIEVFRDVIFVLAPYVFP